MVLQEYGDFTWMVSDSEELVGAITGEIRLVFVHCNKLMNNSGLETDTDTGSNCSE